MKIRKEDLQELYPLTRMQEGMLFHALRDPASTAYTEQVVWRVQGNFDPERYAAAWQTLHDRYEALRSVFTHEKTRQPLQMVLKQRPADVVWDDLRALPEMERETACQARRRQEREQAFDLGSGPLLRVRGLHTGAETWEIIITWHHILLDGWSTHRLFQELAACYAQPDLALPPLPRYAPYIEWLGRQDTAASLAWWSAQLQDYEGLAEIPRDAAAGGQTGGENASAIARQVVSLAHAGPALATLCQNLGVTANSVLQSIWGLLLARYTDSRDVVFGAVVSGRSPEVPDIERLPGLLINTIPVRVCQQADDSFAGLVHRVHQQALDAQSHQACRLADIQNATAQRADLIKHLLVFENYPVDAAPVHGDGLQLQVVESSEPTNYDLLLVADPGAGLRLEFQYRPQAYAPARIHRLARHFVALLDAALARPDSPLDQLDCLSADEKNWLIHGVNAQVRSTPDQTLAQRFAEQVANFPDHPALVWSGGRATYRELAARSRGLARLLASRGVSAGQRVGVCLDRSPALIETLLAITQLGASYVAIDPESPASRLRFIVEDAGLQVLVLRATGPTAPGGVTILHPDAEGAALAALAADATPLPNPPTRAADEACVLYTSGSTGMPKAVCLAHRGIQRLCSDPDYFRIGPDDRMAHVSNVAFDAATFEIWGALLNGAALHLISRETALNPGALARAIRDQGLTHLLLTTALFNQMAREVPDGLAPLRALFTGGEKADPEWMRRILERGAPGALINAYGPTECTTIATVQPVTAALLDAGGDVPIGLPIANTQAYVVDQAGRLQVPGAPGELWLGGEGIALGYLNRPAITAGRFVTDPFLGTGRLYRTGDIVRRDEAGRLHFVGRRDQQVKLRGFRIELGEIEAVLRTFPKVQEALVIVHEDAGNAQRKLVAYLALDGQPGPHVDLELRRFLKERLPDYMIPATFVILERLPLTANGKIDRQALPQPSRTGTGFGKAFIAPVGDVEQQLAALWASVLGVPQVGRNDSFFELGGHSLTASTAIAQIRASFKVDIPLPFFFQCPNLETLAGEIARLQVSAPAKVGGIARVARSAPPSGTA